MVKRLAMPEGRMRLHNDDKSTIVGIWEWETPRASAFARLKSARDAVIDIAPAVRSRRQALQQDGTLTDAGITKTILGDVPAAAQALRKAERVVAREKANIAKRRGELTLRPPDKSDIAGELQRQEIRAWARGLSQQERDAFFGRDDVPPAIAEAVMSAPRELSQVAASHYGLLKDRAVEAQNPGLAEELAEVEQAISVVERTIQANSAGLVEEIGLQHRAAIEQLSNPAMREVDEAEAKAAPAEASASADELFGALDSLSHAERSRLLDRALETQWSDVGAKGNRAANGGVAA
jgi:hypothetical protein